MALIRSALFEIAYWLVTISFAIFCALLAALPGKRPLSFGLFTYGRAMAFIMRVLAGIRIDMRGTRHLSRTPAVIAAKHQSWGDGFVMLATVRPLAFVAGDHLMKFPLIGFILKKAGAVVLSNQGGEAARARMSASMEALKRDKRHILIYPEGHLAAPGKQHPYRKGVYHLARELGRPVLPVATSLGLAWDRQSFIKHPRRVSVEFLEPIHPGEDKDAFMRQLEDIIEGRTAELIRAGNGEG